MEVLAYGWMHPAPAGIDQPVLCYRPQMKDRGAKIADDTATASLDPPRSPIHDPPSSPTDTRPPPTDHSSSSIQNPKSKIQYPASVTDCRYTLLPEIVARSLPSLHCSTGTAARVDRDDGASIHLAFFEWELADSTSVLEAYKHLPEQCMGAIGLTLTSRQPPRFFQVGSEQLAFDHTVFRDPAGVILHAFKGTWVSGASTLLGRGLRGGAEQARRLRWTAAIKRFRPAHARVAQGAVRGIPNPDLAWLAFQDAMLVDLLFDSL